MAYDRVGVDLYDGNFDDLVGAGTKPRRFNIDHRVSRNPTVHAGSMNDGRANCMARLLIGLRIRSDHVGHDIGVRHRVRGIGERAALLDLAGSTHESAERGSRERPADADALHARLT